MDVFEVITLFPVGLSLIKKESSAFAFRLNPAWGVFFGNEFSIDSLKVIYDKYEKEGALNGYFPFFIAAIDPIIRKKSIDLTEEEKASIEIVKHAFLLSNEIKDKDVLLDDFRYWFEDYTKSVYSDNFKLRSMLVTFGV